MKRKEGWRSIAYRQRVPRTSVSFDVVKDTPEAIRYITVIYPVKDTVSFPKIKAKFLNKKFDEEGVRVEVSVNGKKRRLEARL
nr:CAZy families PL12 protein [uncultured Bacteroides sp.]